MEEVQNRVQNAVNGAIDELDRTHFRVMQASMYRCSAKCCENDSYGMDDVQRCISSCNKPLTSAQEHVQTELGDFQNRLQRCAMACQDQVKDKMGASPSQDDMLKHKPGFEKCLVKCADSHIALLPQMMSRVKDVLKQHQAEMK